MPQRQNYKNRTVHVRQSARAHLQELRNQRLARRSQLTTVDKPDAKVFAEGVKPLLEEQQPSIGLGTQELTADAEASNLDSSCDVVEPRSQIGFPEVEACVNSPERQVDPKHQQPDLVAIVPAGSGAEMKSFGLENAQGLDDRSVEKMAVSEMDDEMSEPTSEVEPKAIPDETQAKSTPDTNVAKTEPCDLFDLPGAGPGLVWMLRQCGISSLEELARAEQEQLTLKLGVVGQILDVQSWITFANAK